MTRIILLERLRDSALEVTKDLIMPVMPTEKRRKPKPRAAEVHLMRLPDESAAKEYAPYIIHQFVTGSDEQQAGERVKSYALVRSIFSVYNKDSSEGSLMLLNLMERLRIAWLEQVVIAQQFQLDLSQKLEGLAYPDDIAPFFAGEMMSVWKMPAVERKVRF